MSCKKIGFIGCGNIASAIIGGMCGSGYIKYENLFVFDTDSSKTDTYFDKGATVCLSASELTKSCDYVFLTVKPQIYDTVLNEIATVCENTCFISVAAGITTEYVKRLLGCDAPVIRVMPNTPLLYHSGATALVHKAPVSNDDFDFVYKLFSLSGVCVSADEDLINVVTAISGSAPAFILRFANVLIDFAVENGMDREDAAKLVLATVSGSAVMATESDDDILTLIKRVTSPNGTTYAGLCSMDKTEFDSSLKECLEATFKRAEELTK